MKILIFSQYFWPESFIINDFVKHLSLQGHEVTVATGKPNYPNGIIFNGYRAGGVQKEEFMPGVAVYRVPLRPRGAGGGKNLILNYFSFVFSGLVYFPFLLRGKKFDTIMVFAPSPIVQALPAIWLKFLKRAHLSIWVQDLWPESLSATGFVKNRFLLWLVSFLVRFIYFFTDMLLVQSVAFTDPVAKFADRKKIAYFPNCFDPAGNASADLPVELVQTLTSNFSFVFAGNLGTAQAVNTICEAAEKIRDLPDCKIVLVGSGSQSKWIEERIEERKLTNLVLAGRFPMESMPRIFELSKVLLVTLKDDPIFRLTIPSKIQAYLASKKPILAAINGEGARIVNEAGAGLTSPAEDPAALALNMRRMYAMKDAELGKMSTSARDYFENNFDMSTQVKKFVSLMAERI